MTFPKRALIHTTIIVIANSELRHFNSVKRLPVFSARRSYFLKHIHKEDTTLVPLIRIMAAVLFTAVFIDFRGIQPDFFASLFEMMGSYTYPVAGLLVSWLLMPMVVWMFE